MRMNKTLNKGSHQSGTFSDIGMRMGEAELVTPDGSYCSYAGQGIYDQGKIDGVRGERMIDRDIPFSKPVTTGVKHVK